MTKPSIALALCLCLLATCSKAPNYKVYKGEGLCANGFQDRGEIGVDCGGSCLNSCINVRYLEGELFTRLSLNPAYQYIITGPLIIRDKASLEIPMGIHIKVQADVGAYIAVTQGGRLFAWGTKDEPITISSNAPDPSPGDWGGLIFCGKAPIKENEPQLSTLGYYFYGGNDTLDSSGYLKYLKIEHAGAAYDDENQFNAISFYGVGSYTSIDNLWIDNVAHSGIEIQGGNLSLQQVYVHQTADNGIHIIGAWQGSGQHWTLRNIGANGVEFQNMAPSTGNFSLLLKDLAVVNSGTYGYYFSGTLGPVSILRGYISTSTEGIGFENENLSSLETLQLLDTRIENSERLSNIPLFSNTFENADSTAIENTGTVPDWINAWLRD